MTDGAPPPGAREWVCPTCGARYRLTPAGPAAAATSSDKITDNQRKLVYKLIGRDPSREDQARKICLERWNVTSTGQLSKKQASELIDQLRSLWE